MSDQIPTHYAQQYADNIELLLQQRGSRLRDTVRPKTITGAKAATAVEQIGAVAAQVRTTRYPSLTPMDTPHERPWVYPVDYDWNDMVDPKDTLRTVVDPMASYSINGSYAMGRAMDDEVIKSFFGTRNIGETGVSTQSFPSGQQIDVNYAASGNVGLTVAKLREAKRLMMAAEVDLDMDPLTVVVTAKQHDNLLAEMQVISKDFNMGPGDMPVLKEGRIMRFLGMNFVHTERLQVDGNSYRRVPVYAKSGICLGIWADMRTEINKRVDLAGHPMQVYVTGTFGATRTEEEKVVEIKCAEA